MVNRRIKVIILMNILAPTRLAFFESLASKSVVQLQVLYCAKKRHDRLWDTAPRKYQYNFHVMKGVYLGSHLNPEVISILLRSKPDVVVIGGYTDLTMQVAFIVCKLLKIPILYWTESIKEPRSILGILTRPIRVFFIKEADAIIVPGRLSKNHVISIGAAKPKVFIAPNAIDNELFIKKSQQYFSSKDELKNKIGLKGKIVILYVGRLTKGKGINFLLEAYKKLKRENNNVSLLLVGYGELYNMLRNEKINDVVMTGPVVKFEHLVQYYSMADIFVFPTLNDVWGFVINEAMACQLPVISTQASQAAIEMVRSGENGYVVKAADPNQLYTALKNLIIAPELRMRMAKKSREIIKCEFDVSRMVEGFLSAIEYCIGVTKNNA